MSNAPRKTFPVAKFRERANFLLGNRDAPRLPEGTTPEQAYRRAWASALEMVLMDTNNYKGFGYLDVERIGDEIKVIDETRRVYYGR